MTAKTELRSEALALALLRTGSIAQACREINMSQRTAMRLTKREPFQKALADARKAAVDGAINGLSQAAQECVATLRAIQADEDAPPQSRVGACRVLLYMLIQVSSFADLEQRLSELERVASNVQHGQMGI